MPSSSLSPSITLHCFTLNSKLTFLVNFFHHRSLTIDTPDWLPWLMGPSTVSTLLIGLSSWFDADFFIIIIISIPRANAGFASSNVQPSAFTQVLKHFYARELTKSATSSTLSFDRCPDLHLHSLQKMIISSFQQQRTVALRQRPVFAVFECAVTFVHHDSSNQTENKNKYT